MILKGSNISTFLPIAWFFWTPSFTLQWSHSFGSYYTSLSQRLKASSNNCTNVKDLRLNFTGFSKGSVVQTRCDPWTIQLWILMFPVSKAQTLINVTDKVLLTDKRSMKLGGFWTYVTPGSWNPSPWTPLWKHYTTRATYLVTFRSSGCTFSNQVW